MCFSSQTYLRNAIGEFRNLLFPIVFIRHTICCELFSPFCLFVVLFFCGNTAATSRAEMSEVFGQG